VTFQNEHTRSARYGLSTVAPIVVLVVFLSVWQSIVWLTGVKAIIMPGPIAVWLAGVELWRELLAATAKTLAAAAAGLSISTAAGVATAFLFSASGLIRKALYPYAVLLQTIPVIALAPIIIVTTGRSFFSICLVSAIISLFPIITNTATGLLQVDDDLLDLFRLHRATWLQTLFRLRLPSAMPYLIAGIRIAGGSAIVGAIVGEFFVGAGSPGLGTLIQRKAAALNLSELFAVVIVSALLGTIVFAFITVCGEALLRNRYGTSLSGVKVRS
jgi:NitT/TauT family transport system permease protein